MAVHGGYRDARRDAQHLLGPPPSRERSAHVATPYVVLICAALAATTALKNLLQGLAVVRGFRFSTFSLIAIVEICKLLFSVMLSMTLKSRTWPSRRDCLLFAIPGLLYMCGVAAAGRARSRSPAVLGTRPCATQRSPRPLHPHPRLQA